MKATHGEPPGLDIRGLTVRYGAFKAITDLTVSLPGGGIIGVVGPNGAGKTTLLNAVSGFTHASEGSILLSDRPIEGWETRPRVIAGVVRSFQTVRLMERESVVTNVLVGTERFNQPRALAQLANLSSQQSARRRDLIAAWQVIELLGLKSQAHKSVGELPFASRRLVEVARVLISRPPVILLDEPAAGLDRQGRDELAAVLTQVHDQHPSTMVVVEHDVDLVKNLCSHAVALDSGLLVASGTPQQVFADKQVQLAYFGRTIDASA